MNQRIYHGVIDPIDMANALMSFFNRGNWRVQRIGDSDHLVVQIATRDQPMAGGQTAMSVDIQRMADGITVQIGQQAWLGVAASLGTSALALLINPWNLLNRLDDIAQDIENLQLTEEVWKVVNDSASALGTTQQLSERLKRVTCEYCGSGNPVGAGNCIACGAPMGALQPRTCLKCGYVIRKNEITCPNCGARL